MLVIKPKAQGAGIFDVISKVANSALAKKVINSAVINKVVGKATKENLVKAANSAVGKQIQTAVVKSVADASDKVVNSTLQKLRLPSAPGAVAKVTEQAVNSTLKEFGIEPDKKVLEQVFAASTLKRKRKLPTKPGRSKKSKRAKAIGTGIILE